MALGTLSVLTALVFSGATLAYKVNYEGQVIATVSRKSQFDKAVTLVAKEIGHNAEDEISSPAYSTVLTLKSSLNTSTELKDAILSNTDSVTYAYALNINGETKLYCENSLVNDLLDEHRNAFNLKSGDSISEFTDDISVEEGYFTDIELATADEIESVIEGLTVKTTATVVTDTDIPYSNTVKRTSSEMLGYSKITKAGKNGLKRTTDTVVYINGKETERKNVSTKTVSQPVSQVTVVGTAKTLATASQRKAAYSSGFIFPLPKGCGWRISSYWGDGRGHKGMDLCTSYGTNIYAVADGTVTYAGFKSDYGYLVVIDHGNGLSTAYAHCSTLGVKTGEKVTSGETIALVGSTGYSTGNHLHFEVRKNGTRIDPAPYIGLD